MKKLITIFATALALGVNAQTTTVPNTVNQVYFVTSQDEVTKNVLTLKYYQSIGVQKLCVFDGNSIIDSIQIHPNALINNVLSYCSHNGQIYAGGQIFTDSVNFKFKPAVFKIVGHTITVLATDFLKPNGDTIKQQFVDQIEYINGNLFAKISDNKTLYEVSITGVKTLLAYSKKGFNKDSTRLIRSINKFGTDLYISGSFKELNGNVNFKGITKYNTVTNTIDPINLPTGVYLDTINSHDAFRKIEVVGNELRFFTGVHKTDFSTYWDNYVVLDKTNYSLISSKSNSNYCDGTFTPIDYHGKYFFDGHNTSSNLNEMWSPISNSIVTTFTYPDGISSHYVNSTTPYRQVLNVNIIADTLYLFTNRGIIKYFDGISTLVAELVENKFLVFPNPTIDIVEIKGEFKTATLIDSKGNVITKGNNSIIEMQNLSNGIYFLVIDGYAKKIIKQ